MTDTLSTNGRTRLQANRRDGQVWPALPGGCERAESDGASRPYLYQPVDEVVVSSERWVKGHSEDDQSWHGAVGDENHDESLVRAIAGREQDKKTPAARHGLFRGPGPDQQAHEQPVIVPGDMDQIALVDILPAPQPRPAHATPVQDVREGALDQFR